MPNYLFGIDQHLDVCLVKFPVMVEREKRTEPSGKMNAR